MPINATRLIAYYQRVLPPAKFGTWMADVVRPHSRQEGESIVMETGEVWNACKDWLFTGTFAVKPPAAPEPTPPKSPKPLNLDEPQRVKVEERLAICFSCVHFKGSTRLTVTCAQRQNRSGCAACNLLNGRCPIDKWGTRPQQAGKAPVKTE